jgi:hypothetical protein
VTAARTGHQIDEVIAQALNGMEDREMVHAAKGKMGVDWAGDDAIYVHLRFANEAFPPVPSKHSPKQCIHPVVECAIHERVPSPFVYFRVETDSEADS